MAKILLLEDDVISALCLTELLIDRGHEVTHVSDTDQAKSALNDSDFDALISDWGVDGSVSAASFARFARERTPEISILFTTGFSQERLQPELLDLVNYSIFVKPLNFEKLIDAVTNHASTI